MAGPMVSGVLDQEVAVETPEQVSLSYSVAGVGSRGAAALVDHLIILATLVLFWGGLYLMARNADTVPRPEDDPSGGWALAVLLLLSFAFLWGYFVFFEARLDGQTPGKRLLHLRVVQDGGYSVSFGASAVRNLARIVDMQPGVLYGVGIVSAGFAPAGKRLGDMMAGTFVVHERVVRLAPPGGTAASAGAGDGMPLTAALTSDEFELLGRFVARSATLDPTVRKKMVDALVARFHAYLEPDGGTSVERLTRLHAAEHAARQQGVAARGAVGAAREREALIAGATARWDTFAALVREAQRRGLRAMSPAQVSEFVDAYREAAADLARLRTASRGHDIDEVFRLGRVVGAGHNLLYRQQRLTGDAVLRFLSGSVPREIRRSALPILAAAVCLFGPVAITYRAVVRDPALAERLLPPGMIDRANEGVARAQRGDRTYVPVPALERPIMGSAIIANNVQVTYAVFAFGITAGVFTVLLLLFNGVSIGAAMALYANKGIFFQLGEFVLPHSVFELSAICIAGGGGLLLAKAILLPGALTRREALVVNGRRAIRLITASTMLLVLAGTIEGNISPRTDIPLWVKVGVSGLSALVLALYIAFGGRGTHAAGSGEQFAYSDERALISR